MIINCEFDYNYAINAGALLDCDYVEICDFYANEAEYSGGAIYDAMSQSSVVNCNFVYNVAGTDGGAIAGANALRCAFFYNSAEYGGAMVAGSADSCIFEDNAASEEGDDTYETEAYKPILSVSDFTSTYQSGDKLDITFTTSEGYSINEDVTIDVYENDVLVGTYNCLSEDGWVVDLDVGNYVALVSVYPGYLIDPVEATLTINPNKAKTKIALQNNDGTLVAKLTRADTGKGISGAYVIFNINNVNYKVKTDSSGQAKLAVPSLDSGTYRVTASYKGNDKYEESSAGIDIYVKANTNLLVDFRNGAREVVATLTNGVTGQVIKNANVRFVVDGVKSTVKTDANGQAKVSVSSLAQGAHAVTVSYDGNSKYNPSTKTISFTISKVMTSISQYYDKATKELVATLINSETGAGIKGATIVFNYNGVKTAMTSDKQGQARLYIGDPVVESASLSYGGNSKYLGSYGSIKLAIEKISTVISNFYYKETQEVVATLVNRETGQAIKGATVVFNFNGVKTALKTDKLGQVKLSVDGLNPDEYYISSSYGGNSKYAGSVARIYFVKI